MWRHFVIFGISDIIEIWDIFDILNNYFNFIWNISVFDTWLNQKNT